MNFYGTKCSAFEAELADVIPVVKTSIGGTRIVGWLCAGQYYSAILLKIYEVVSVNV